MKYSVLILILLVTSANARAQQRLEDLKLKLLSADSVVIVSHEATAGIGFPEPLPKLILNNMINYSIIHERKMLSDTAVKRLSYIISRPFQDSIIEKGMCFIPHHAVVLFKKGKTSYIDICFGCRGIETSKNIKITAGDIDNRKWEELIAFFKEHDMKYELEGDEPLKEN